MTARAKPTIADIFATAARRQQQASAEQPSVKAETQYTIRCRGCGSPRQNDQLYDTCPRCGTPYFPPEETPE